MYKIVQNATIYHNINLCFITRTDSWCFFHKTTQERVKLWAKPMECYTTDFKFRIFQFFQNFQN